MKNSFMKDQNNHIHRSHLIHRVTRINQIPRFNTFTRLKRITLIIRIKFIRIARFIHFTRTNPSQPQILPSGSLYLFLKNPPEIMTVSFKFPYYACRSKLFQTRLLLFFFFCKICFQVQIELLNMDTAKDRAGPQSNSQLQTSLIWAHLAGKSLLTFWVPEFWASMCVYPLMRELLCKHQITPFDKFN